MSQPRGPGPKAALLRGQVCPSQCSALQMGHQDHGAGVVSRGDTAACPLPAATRSKGSRCSCRGRGPQLLLGSACDT